jgi:hypothetical protein
MDTALARAPDEVKNRFIQTVKSAQREQHGNTARLTGAAHDPHTEPGPGADFRNPLSGNDDPGSLLTELAPNPCIISEMSYSGDDGIVDYSEERPEGSQSHPG